MSTDAVGLFLSKMKSIPSVETVVGLVLSKSK
jgi:hypothetical protein